MREKLHEKSHALNWRMRTPIPTALKMSNVCGHCSKTLGFKALKEHRRKYYFGSRWITQREIAGYSPCSSPLKCAAATPDSSTHDADEVISNISSVPFVSTSEDTTTEVCESDDYIQGK